MARYKMINGKRTQLNAKEEAQRDQDEADFKDKEIAKAETEAKAKADKEANNNLKASAKQKLMNGEALTEDEANVMVGL